MLKLEELEDKLNKIYDFETKGLIIRSKVRWLEEGEKCTKYFCNLENRFWRKKTISRVQDSQGNVITDPDRISKEIHSFYCNLYSNFEREVQNEDISEALFDKV